MNKKKICIILIATFMLFTTLLSGCNKESETPGTEATPEPKAENPASNTSAEETNSAAQEIKPLDLLSLWGNVKLEKDVYNILLLGTDADNPESEGGRGHNDTTMIMQIDRVNKTMKLVSFMRDMVVTIPGRGETRINDAVMYGGAPLAVRTMESVFDVEIDYYALVSFIAFEQILMVVGNIMVTIQEHDVANLRIGKSAVSIDGEQITGTGIVTGPGPQELTPYIALSYARERHGEVKIEDGTIVYGDTGRNYRQRELIAAAWEKVKTYDTTAVPGAAILALAYIETDMPIQTMVTLLTEMMDADITIIPYAIPVEGSKWAAWKDDSTGQYVSDQDVKALYEIKKDAFYTNQAEKQAEAIAAATAAGQNPPTFDDAEEFESYESWRTDRYSSNVVKWSQRNIRYLHDFLKPN